VKVKRIEAKSVKEQKKLTVLILRWPAWRIELFMLSL